MLGIIENMIILRSIVFILLLLDQCTSQCREEENFKNILTEDETSRILVTCQDINLPLQHIYGGYRQFCIECPKTLKIIDSQITVVPSSAFYQYSDLHIIILCIENQGIQTIHPEAFNNMNHLEQLYLSGNKLQQIEGIFDPLVYLKILDLSSNLIKDVPIRCFDKLANLMTLNLSFNEVLFFADSMLDRNVHLKHIDLSFNKISTLNVGTTVHSINNIDLSNNQIDEFNFGLFNFKNLNLSRNKIRNLKIDEQFSSSVQTTHFDVSYNEISQIVPNFFMILKNLQYLNLGHNHISNIPLEIFHNMNHLADLYLSHNKFEQILEIFNSSSNLEILDLSNNIIREVRPNCFKKLVNLKTLDMSSNELTTFSDSLLSEKVRLKNIDLSFNNISKLNIGTIARNIDNLDLSNNKIDEFSPSFFDSIYVNMSRNELTNLKVDELSSSSWKTIHLDLSYNKIAELKSTFIVNMSHLQYLNLGQNSISNIPHGFFSGMNELIYLNLSYNHIEKFQHGVFDNLLNLEILDISHNELEEIEKYLHSLLTLKELNIDSNKLKSLDSVRLRFYLPRLITLSLENNNFTCDKLTNIVHAFRVGYGSISRISRGSNTSTSNIFGIACIDENSKNGSTEGPPAHIISMSKNVSNESEKWSTEFHKNDAMFNYFNGDFLNSNFYKYMENLSNSHPIKINETGIYNYFNEDFKNSEFFKYMENFRNEHDSSSRFHDSVYQYFNSDFRNSSFVKFFESLRAHEELLNAGFKNSIMYNFFNKDFKNSDFYQYSRNLSCPLAFSGNPKSDNTSNLNKLIYTFESSNNNKSAISVATLILLVLIVLLLICLVYNNSFKGHFSRSEQIELMDA